ncbi:MAG TPA: efflux RND transporter periplasmic adaptor subunit [Terriglobales bacterium]|nr:efflux RND transporter periplasmic adaptor subunit [Terriglobales bacterium]
MSTGKKLLIFFAIILLLGGVVAVSLNQQGKDKTTVQTARALDQGLISIVTASGEITPKTYADISPNNVGQITDLYVKEGDHVKAGQLLAKLWNVQQAASVSGMQAGLKTSQANLAAQQAALGTAQANVERDTAQLAQVTQDWRRTQALFEDKLIARSDYETKQAAYKTAEAQLQVSQASLKQTQAQVASLEAGISQAEAQLKSATDALDRTEFTSPLTGIVTYMPVHVGDTVVMGIQNSPGSVLMRVADMSVVTAEVQVDETDIANVKVGQPAVMTIDAFGDQKFPGRVTEVGDTAILRSTGAAATSSSGSDAQQAKDFKVVVQLDQPPPDIRPGLSCTAQITTATVAQAISIPLQAVVERVPSQINVAPTAAAQAAAEAAMAAPAAGATKETPVQGVFVVNPQTMTAEFVPATTGITGVDHVQVLSGVKAGQEIITGPYTALRTLVNHAKIKIDNSAGALAASTPPASN